MGARQDIPQLLQGMDCFLFPSLHEGLPVTLIEAQASGLPITAASTITSEVAITSLVQFYSLQDNNDAWASAALGQALQHRELRTSPSKQIADAGYDIRQTAAWLTEFYQTLIASQS